MKKAKESVSTAIAVCLFVIFSVVFMWDFSRTVIGVTERRTQTRVEEMSDQIGKTFRIKMEDSIDYIQGVAYSLSIHDLEAEDLPRLLKSMDNDTLFSYLDVISSDGTFISSGKICDEIVDYNYFSGENKGTFGVGDHILHSKELGEVFVMYAPVYNKENVIGLVFGLLKATELEKQINAQSFEGYGNSLIFQQSGHIMVSSHDLGYDNIYDMLHNVEFPEGGSKEQVLYTVKNGGRDYLSVKADGVDTFVAFSPVGVNDWYIATGVTKAYMANYADAIVDAAKRLSLKYIAMFMVLLAYVGWRMIRSKEQVEQAYDELKISHRMFEIAIEGTNDAIFNYDIRTKEANYARRPEYVKAPYGTHLENLPQDYEKYFSLHPDYVKSYVDMYEAVRSGKPVAEADVYMKVESGEYRWNRITLTTVYDSNKNPVAAIGFSKDITAEKLVMEKLDTETKYREAILNNTIFAYEFNVSKGVITNLRQEDERDLNFYDLDHYLFRMAYGQMKNIDYLHPEDTDKVAKFFAIGNVQSAYERGFQFISVEYRIQDRFENWIWIENSLHFLYDSTKEIKGIAYVKNINDMKLNQLRLKTRLEIDDLTGVYNRQTAQERITAVLEDRKNAAEVHAFAIFDIDNFKNINDSYGHQVGDEVLKLVAKTFVADLRQSDIVARLGGDEFIVFIKDVKNVGVAMAKVEAIEKDIQGICVSQKDGRCASLSVGIAMSPKDGTDFQELYVKADKALYTAKANGKARIEMYENQ